MARDERSCEKEGLKLISKCPIDDVEKYLDGVVNSICGQRGHPFHEFSKVWSVPEFWQSNDAWKELFKSLRTPGLSDDEVMSKIQFIPNAHREAAAKVWNRRADDIRQMLLGETEQISGPTLKDFDWRVKLVLGSNSMASQKIPLLSLDLTLLEQRKERDVSLEMSSDEVHRLITVLEAAHKAAVQLQT